MSLAATWDQSKTSSQLPPLSPRLGLLYPMDKRHQALLYACGFRKGKLLCFSSSGLFLCESKGTA
jgi:hypothetical protein